MARLDPGQLGKQLSGRGVMMMFLTSDGKTWCLDCQLPIGSIVATTPERCFTRLAKAIAELREAGKIARRSPKKRRPATVRRKLVDRIRQHKTG